VERFIASLSGHPHCHQSSALSAGSLMSLYHAGFELDCRLGRLQNSAFESIPQIS